MHNKSTHKAERTAEERGVAVGDVLRASWDPGPADYITLDKNGPSFTRKNIDYYEVTGLVGARMAEIRKIDCESIETTRVRFAGAQPPGHFLIGWCVEGNSVPVKGRYIGLPMRRVAKNGTMKIDQETYGPYKIRVEVRLAHKMTPTKVVQNGTVKDIYPASHWAAYEYCFGNRAGANNG